MCGITGIISKHGIDNGTIEKMTSVLAHRGPDATGIYINDQKTVALGHTRLSIIDLSKDANQPMYSGNGRYIIIYNGELYNHSGIRQDLKLKNPSLRFKTNSDTETILMAFEYWGAEMLSKMEGMFALAIYDTLTERLFLARDRIGKKPLYYSEEKGVFVFGSEIKSLLHHPSVMGNRKLNPQAIYNFLHLGYIPEPHSVYSGIRKFPSGHYGWIDHSLELKLNPFWRIEDCFLRQQSQPGKPAIEELESLLQSAVKKRLISDVPLGTFLSGGTDSSLITAIASRLVNEKLKTFTIGFMENKFDESPYAARVAGHLRTEHHSYILSEKEAIDILENYISHFDEPFADTSAIPTMLVSQLARNEITVALTGDGGDELFLGYGSYDWANRLGNKAFRLIQPFSHHMLGKYGSSRQKRVAHLLHKVPGIQLRSHIFSQEQYLFEQAELKNKLLTNGSGYESFEYNDIPDRSFSEAEKQALFDLKYYLKDDLLVKVDRASMYHSLECRCPLLDHHVVEYASLLPYTMKKRGSERKWILKELLKKYLPEELIFRPKQGFSIPLSKWLKNELGFLIDDFLNKSVINNAGMVNYSEVEKIKKSFMKGEDFLYNRLWVLIVLHKWLSKNG